MYFPTFIPGSHRWLASSQSTWLASSCSISMKPSSPKRFCSPPASSSSSMRLKCCSGTGTPSSRSSMKSGSNSIMDSFPDLLTTKNLIHYMISNAYPGSRVCCEKNPFYFTGPFRDKGPNLTFLLFQWNNKQWGCHPRNAWIKNFRCSVRTADLSGIAWNGGTIPGMLESKISVVLSEQLI